MAKKSATRATAEPKQRLASADPAGRIEEVRGWTPAARSGSQFRLAEPDELIPLPQGARLQYLEGRAPLGWPRGSSPEEAPVALTGSFAVAAQLPSGYCRTLLPAFRRESGPPYLPFFGYTHVVFRDGKPYCAAVQTDDNPHWDPKHYASPALERIIEERIAASPENRVLKQLKVCSLEYGCYNAQNTFLGRWEGAVTVSPACNAQCIGCISEQPDDLPASPQSRFRFVPTLDEVVEVGEAHLRDRDSIFSFGQGCEGEPLLQAKLIASAVAELRRRTDLGTIHLNTNASKPDGFARAVEAGLDSVRISLNSVLSPQYTAYYQPRGYTFEDVVSCARVARDHGLIVYLNYLHMPGWNDCEEEVSALIRFVNEHGVNMIQMRNLNIDPDLYSATVSPPGGKSIGIPGLLRELRKNCPGLRIGNHTLPRYRFLSAR